MSQTKYSLTPEHREQMKPWAEKWIANAMSTKPMDEEDRRIMRQSIKGLYESAGLTPPPEHRIVFVPSPFVLRFAGGFAAAIWHLRKSDAATRDATSAAVTATTSATTRDAVTATAAATRVATRVATYASTRATTSAAVTATRDATHDATRDAATDALSPNAEDRWYRCADFAAIAKELLGDQAKFGLLCAQSAWAMWQGGNQWSSFDAMLSFFRHVVKLDIDYSKYRYWEDAAIHGGPRIMHPEFCMISDRPMVLKVDDQNRPHCDDGPFCLWRDGSALYAIHGVRVPSRVVLAPHTLTAEQIRNEQNAEVRRVMMTRFGEARYLQEIGGKLIHSDELGELYRAEIENDEPLVMVRVLNSTPEPDGSYKPYWLRVPPTVERASDAVAWTFGFENAAEYAQNLVSQT